MFSNIKTRSDINKSTAAFRMIFFMGQATLLLLNFRCVAHFNSLFAIVHCAAEYSIINIPSTQQKSQFSRAL